MLDINPMFLEDKYNPLPKERFEMYINKQYKLNPNDEKNSLKILNNKHNNKLSMTDRVPSINYKKRRVTFYDLKMTAKVSSKQ